MTVLKLFLATKGDLQGVELLARCGVGGIDGGLSEGDAEGQDSLAQRVLQTPQGFTQGDLLLTGAFDLAHRIAGLKQFISFGEGLLARQQCIESILVNPDLRRNVGDGSHFAVQSGNFVLGGLDGFIELGLQFRYGCDRSCLGSSR